MNTTALSTDAQATALLVGRFGMSQAKPLSRTDFNRVALSLHERGLRPSDLFRQIPSDLPVDELRLRGLIARGAALALAVDAWDQQGIRMVSRGDADYPQRFKKLKGGAAPILYYAGDLAMLESYSLGVVGSRDATDGGKRFSLGLGERAAREEVAIVSGDARGVDRSAMESALYAGGKVIGVLSDSLSKSVLSKRYRQAIGQGRVLLISHVEPDARFTVAQAMERNRYIYAASDAVVVADSDVKGGTWNGAVENLKHAWSPGYARIGPDMREGGRALVHQGMIALADAWLQQSDPIASLFEGRMAASNELPLFSSPHAEPSSVNEVERDTLFGLFKTKLITILQGPLTVEDIADRLGIEVNQAEKWLSRAANEGHVRTDGHQQWYKAQVI